MLAFSPFGTNRSASACVSSSAALSLGVPTLVQAPALFSRYCHWPLPLSVAVIAMPPRTAPGSASLIVARLTRLLTSWPALLMASSSIAVSVGLAALSTGASFCACGVTVMRLLNTTVVTAGSLYSTR